MKSYPINTPLEELYDQGHLSTRTWNALKNAEINTLNSLLLYTKKQLHTIRNLGRMSIQEIEKFCDLQGYKLAVDVPVKRSIINLFPIRTLSLGFGHNDNCLFNVRTLLQIKSKNVIVSTVGLMYSQHQIVPIGVDDKGEYYFESMAFSAVQRDVNIFGNTLSSWGIVGAQPIESTQKYRLYTKESLDSAGNLHDRAVKEFSEIIRK